VDYVGKGHEQERKLFRRSDCRKHPPWLTPSGLIPAYIQVNVRAQMMVLNRLVYNDERGSVGTIKFKDFKASFELRYLCIFGVQSLLCTLRLF
jgi:hypothetical protein